MRASVAVDRFSIDSPSRPTMRSAYASRSASPQVPSPTSSSPAASPSTRPAGSSWSWIQTIHFPSGARDGSTAHGWPATIVASAGRSPRSASFTARETPSSPGVTWTIAVLSEPLRVRPFPPRRLVEREVDLHPRAAVAVARRRGVDVGGDVGRAEERAVEPGRRHARDDGAGRADRLSVGEDDTDRAAAGDRDPRDLRVRPEVAARVPDDALERLDEADAAADRHRHPAELDGARDDLGHEPRHRVVRAEPRVEHPRREQAAGLGGGERGRRPVAAGRECVTRELEQSVAAEAAEKAPPEPEPGRRPELGAEHAEREVGVRHEPLELTLPRGAVTRRVAVELGDVCFHRRLQEHRPAVREGGRGREPRVDVLEPSSVELVAQLGVGGRPREERMPRAHHLVREPRQGVVRLRPDRTAEPVGALEHADAPSLPRQERRGGHRVDARPDEDGVEGRHAATLRGCPQSATNDSLRAAARPTQNLSCC